VSWLSLNLEPECLVSLLQPAAVVIKKDK